MLLPQRRSVKRTGGAVCKTAGGACQRVVLFRRLENGQVSWSSYRWLYYPPLWLQARQLRRPLPVARHALTMRPRCRPRWAYLEWDAPARQPPDTVTLSSVRRARTRARATRRAAFAPPLPRHLLRHALTMEPRYRPRWAFLRWDALERQPPDTVTLSSVRRARTRARATRRAVSALLPRPRRLLRLWRRSLLLRSHPRVG